MGDSSSDEGPSGGDLCELCEKVIGRIACDACDMEALCENCDVDLHKAGKLHSHKRQWVESGEALPPLPGSGVHDDESHTNPPHTVASSLSALALLSASSPVGSPSNLAMRPRASINLLARPPLSMHPRGSIAIGGLGSIQEHSRAEPVAAPTELSDDSSPASTEQFVKMCDACGGERASWYCSSCQRFSCTACDHTTHKASSMKNHPRAPYPPVFGKPAALAQIQEAPTSVDESPPSSANAAGLRIYLDSPSPSAPQVVLPSPAPSPAPTDPRMMISPALLALSSAPRTLAPGGGRNSRAMSVMAPAGGGRSSLSPMPTRVTPINTSPAAPAHGGARLSTIHNVLCDICEDSKASVYCAECDMHLCISNQCDEQLHAPLKLRGHQRNPINTLSFAMPTPSPAASPSPTPGASSSPPLPTATPSAAAAPRAVLTLHPTPMLHRPTASVVPATVAATPVPMLSPQQMRPRSSSVMMKSLPLSQNDSTQAAGLLGLIPAAPRPAPAPAPDASTARTSRGTRLCEICEVHPAAVYCAACPLYLCNSGGCNTQIHLPAKMSHHFRTGIPKAMCTICEENVGDVWCFDCRQHYCTADGCDEGFHRPAKMATHQRQRVDHLHPTTNGKATTPKSATTTPKMTAMNAKKATTPKSATTTPKSGAKAFAFPVTPQVEVALVVASSPTPAPVLHSESKPVPHSSPVPTSAVVSVVPSTPLSLLASSATPTARGRSFFVVCDACDTSLATRICDTCRDADRLSLTHFYCTACDETAHAADGRPGDPHLHHRRDIVKADIRTTPFPATSRNGPAAPDASPAVATPAVATHLGLTNVLLPLAAVTNRLATTTRVHVPLPSASPVHSPRPSTLLSAQLPVATARAPTLPTMLVSQLPTCDRCSVLKADLFCEDCELNLDSACFHELHKSSSSKLHPKKILVESGDGSGPKPLPAQRHTSRLSVKVSAAVADRPHSARIQASSPLHSRSPVPPLDFTSGRLILGGPLHASALLPASMFDATAASSPDDSASSSASSPRSVLSRRSRAPTTGAASAKVEAKDNDDEFALESIESLLTDDEAPPPKRKHKKQKSVVASKKIATDKPLAVTVKPAGVTARPLESLESELAARVTTLERDLQESVQLKSSRIHSARQQALSNRGGRPPDSLLTRNMSFSRPSARPAEPSRPRPSLIAIAGAPSLMRRVSLLPPVVDDTPAAMAAIRLELTEARSQLQQFHSLTQALTVQLQQQQQAVSLIQQQQHQQQLLQQQRPLPAELSSPPPSSSVPPLFSQSEASSPSPLAPSLGGLSVPFQQELALLISHTIQATLQQQQSADPLRGEVVEAKRDFASPGAAKASTLRAKKKRPATADQPAEQVSSSSLKRDRVQSAAAARVDSRPNSRPASRPTSPTRRPVGTLFHKPIRAQHPPSNATAERQRSLDRTRAEASDSSTPDQSRAVSSDDTDHSSHAEKPRRLAALNHTRTRSPDFVRRRSVVKRSPPESTPPVMARRASRGSLLVTTRLSDDGAQQAPLATTATPSSKSRTAPVAFSVISRRGPLDASVHTPLAQPQRSASKPRFRDENDAVVFLAPGKREPRARASRADSVSVPTEVNSHRMSDEEEEEAVSDSEDEDVVSRRSLIIGSARSVSSATTSLIARYRSEAAAAMSTSLAGSRLSSPSRLGRSGSGVSLDRVGLGHPALSSTAQVGGVSATKRRARELRRQAELTQQLTIERQLRVTDHRRIEQLHHQLHRLQAHIEYQQTQAEWPWRQEQEAKANRAHADQHQHQLREREHQREAVQFAALDDESSELRHRARLAQQQYDQHQYSAVASGVGHLQSSASVPSLSAATRPMRPTHSLSKLMLAQTYAESVRDQHEERKESPPLHSAATIPLALDTTDEGHLGVAAVDSAAPLSPLSLSSLLSSPSSGNRATLARDILLASSFLREPTAVDSRVSEVALAGRGRHVRSSTTTSALAAAMLSPAATSAHRITLSAGREEDLTRIKPSHARRLQRDRLALRTMHQRAASTGHLHGGAPHAAATRTPIDTKQLLARLLQPQHSPALQLNL